MSQIETSAAANAAPALLTDTTPPEVRAAAAEAHAAALQDDLGLLRQMERAARDEVTRLEAVAAHQAGQLVRLSELVSHDPLTGLLNRRGLLERWRPRPGEVGPAAVVVLDLNGFKNINDRLGHRAGDLVLAAIGKRLAALPWADAARTGGDEFVVLIAAGLDVPTLVEGIDQTIRHPIDLGDGREVRISAGIGWTPAGGESLQVLVARADQAAYQSKTTGAPVAWSAELSMPPPRPGGRRFRDAPRGCSCFGSGCDGCVEQGTSA